MQHLDTKKMQDMDLNPYSFLMSLPRNNFLPHIRIDTNYNSNQSHHNNILWDNFLNLPSQPAHCKDFLQYNIDKGQFAIPLSLQSLLEGQGRHSINVSTLFQDFMSHQYKIHKYIHSWIYMYPSCMQTDNKSSLLHTYIQKGILNIRLLHLLLYNYQVYSLFNPLNLRRERSNQGRLVSVLHLQLDNNSRLDGSRFLELLSFPLNLKDVQARI